MLFLNIKLPLQCRCFCLEWHRKDSITFTLIQLYLLFLTCGTYIKGTVRIKK